MQTIRVRPTPVASAYPSSSMTFGFGVSRVSGSGPLTGVRSATNSSQCSIFARIVAAMSGQPATLSVSWSTRSASSSASPRFRSLTARSSAQSIVLRVSGRSDCQEKKTVPVMCRFRFGVRCRQLTGTGNALVDFVLDGNRSAIPRFPVAGVDCVELLRVTDQNDGRDSEFTRVPGRVTHLLLIGVQF